jgi:hypothetical protein
MEEHDTSENEARTTACAADSAGSPEAKAGNYRSGWKAEDQAIAIRKQTRVKAPTHPGQVPAQQALRLPEALP